MTSVGLRFGAVVLLLLSTACDSGGSSQPTEGTVRADATASSLPSPPAGTSPTEHRGSDLPDSRAAAASLQAKDFPAARAALQRLTDASQAQPGEYVQLSELHLADGQREKGEHALRAGLTRFPDHPYLTFRLGSYLAALTRYREATELLAKANALAPDDMQVLKLLSIAQARTGDPKAAAASAARLFQRQPRAENGVLYASLLESSGNVTEAERIYRQVLSTASDDAIVLNNLATLLTGKGKLMEAEGLARRAVAREPGNGRILDTLGSIQYKAGRVAEAAETFGRAVDLAPNASNVHYHLALALASVGRADDAAAALADARRLDPAATWPDLPSRPTAGAAK